MPHSRHLPSLLVVAIIATGMFDAAFAVTFSGGGIKGGPEPIEPPRQYFSTTLVSDPTGGLDYIFYRGKDSGTPLSLKVSGGVGIGVDPEPISPALPFAARLSVDGSVKVNGRLEIGIGGTMNENIFIGKTGTPPSPYLPGSFNTAVGLNSLSSNIISSNNTAVGAFGLQNNTEGWNNTSQGAYSLSSNTTGWNNTAQGSFSLSSNSTGWNNTAIGQGALYWNTTGSGNVAMGFDALNTATGVSFQTAIGYQALRSNTTGTNNHAFGPWALLSNTTGSDNVAIGSGALYSNTTGQWNTAIGNRSLESNIVGYGNTGIGFGSLRNTTGNNNTAIGNGADAFGAVNNATAIGAGAIVMIPDALVLGNSSVKVGIGTSSPSQKLAVVGGGILIDPGSGTKPPCTSVTRGTIWTTFGGAGVADTTEICRKNINWIDDFTSIETYDWTMIY